MLSDYDVEYFKFHEELLHVNEPPALVRGRYNNCEYNKYNKHLGAPEGGCIYTAILYILDVTGIGFISHQLCEPALSQI